MSWDIKDDQFFYKIKINFSPKVKMMHSEPNVSFGELEQCSQGVWYSAK